MIVSGSCLCGRVRYRAEGPLRPVSACHCTQCRKQTGSFVHATAARRDGVTVEGAEAITWYESSPGIRRGFCDTCGSHLFWDPAGRESITIFAGTLDGRTGLTMVEHIFCASKGDYYELTDGLPQFDAYPPAGQGAA